MRFVSFGWDFTKGTSGAIVATVAAVSDPLKWPKAFGMLTDYTWPIEDGTRQLIFAVVAILWMFVWYCRQRLKFEDSLPQEPNMPLHIACRWIARDSVWASDFKPARDGQWVALVAKELESKLIQGRIEIFGERWPFGGNPEAMQHVTPAEKRLLKWEAEKLVSGEPPTHMATTNAIFHQVMLDRKRVTQIWPRRSLWARLWKRSPIERIAGSNYGGQFSEQDRLYREQFGFTATPLWMILS